MMNKGLRTVFTAVLFLALAFVPSDLCGACVSAAVVFAAALLGGLTVKLYKLADQKTWLTALVFGAFFAVLFTVLAAAFCYDSFAAIKSAWPFMAVAAGLLAALWSGSGIGMKLCHGLTAALLMAVCGILAGILSAGALGSLQLFEGGSAIFGKTGGRLLLLGLLLAACRSLMPAALQEDLKAGGLCSDFSLRFCGKSVPAALRGMPVLVLAMSLVAMAVYAF